MLHDRLADVVGPRYALERELTAGGMARVFLARDPLLDRRVVIKVLPPERATAVGMERFHREARLLARLNHPHIIPILDTGTSHELPWFAMPWIAGQTLADRLDGGALTAAEVREIGRELLDALAHAHALGVVHRDIKPANIFLHAGHALLADFGVATLTGSSGDALTEAGTAVGTMAYMAPEHRLQAQCDPRSDIWELAATLYEACTGRRWTSTATTSDPWRGVPHDLDGVLRRALADDPGQRWPDAAAFREALRRRPARRARISWVGAGLLAVVLPLAWWRGPSRGSPGDRSSDPNPDPVQFVAEAGAPSWVTEAARNASSTLRWLPAVRGGPDRPALPIRIVLRQRGSSDTLILEGRDADNVLALRHQVGGGSSDWSRAIVESTIEQLFPSRLDDFRLLVHSTANVQALNAWYRGSEAFQAALWDDADRHYREALQYDPGFIAASWSLLLTDMWRRVPHQDALTRLLERRALLPPVIRELVEAQVEPHLPTRIARFDSLAAVFPGFWPVRMLQANELFHRGPLIGRPLQDGVRAFIGAAEQAPDLDHRTTWQHVLWGAIRLGDEAAARAAWDRMRQWPGDLELDAFLGLALDARFSAQGATARRGLVHLAAHGDRLGDMARYLRLGNDFDIPDEVRRMSRLVARRSEDREAVASATATLATTLLMTGHLHAALAALDRAAALSATPHAYQMVAAEWRVLLPQFGMDPGDEERQDGAAVLLRMSSDRQFWPRAVWALAVTSPGRAGDGWGDSLRRGAAHDSLARYLLPFWTAEQLAREANVTGALEASSAIHTDPGDSMVVARGSLVRAITYLARGRWHLMRGDSLAAEREWRWHENNDLQGWPSGPPQDGEMDVALSGPTRLLRATLLCSMGERSAGRTLMSRTLELWASADPGFGREWPTRRAAERACR